MARIGCIIIPQASCQRSTEAGLSDMNCAIILKSLTDDWPPNKRGYVRKKEFLENEQFFRWLMLK